jgi:hypothetical protein
MSYEAKYLKYKNKYLALKAQLKGAQMSGGGGKLERTETETTLSNIATENNSLSESMDNLFKQLGGATRSRKSSRSSSRKSSRKASKKSSRKSRGSRSNFFDDSDEDDDDDIMDKMNDQDDDFSSSELDW